MKQSKLIIALLFAIALLYFKPVNAQNVFTVVNGMNVCIKVPSNYSSLKKYPTIVFFPGAGEIGTNKDLLVKYGPNAFAKTWNNTTVTPNAGTVDAYNLCIGRSPAPYAPYWFDGRIDEVGVWNIALDASQVTALYNSGAGKAYSTF